MQIDPRRPTPRATPRHPRTHRWRAGGALLFAATLLLAAGCGGGSGTSGDVDADDDVAMDTTEQDVTGDVAPGDTTADTVADTSPPDTTGGDTSSDITGNEPDFRLHLTVDDSLTPSLSEYPALDDGVARPVSAVGAVDGRSIDFVSDELLLMTDDEAELDAFLDRWSGEVLESTVPQDAGIDVPALYRIRVDASAADTSRTNLQLAALHPNVRNELVVSDEAGHRLLAAFASEASGGAMVGVSFVMRGAGYRDRSITEAPVTGEPTNGNPISGYSPNAYDWDILRDGGPLDVGVTEAWRMLDLAGALGNRVTIGVLDGGFAANPDFPADYTELKLFPGSTNPVSCGSSDCPYHGTGVAEVAAAVPDNDFGTVGTAGPIADLVAVQLLTDPFSVTHAINLAIGGGASVINMSFGGAIPAGIDLGLLPFEAFTVAVHASGVLLFAAAGNDGEHVDSESCFEGCFPAGVLIICEEICWEDEWWIPCENDGVTCVGGTNATDIGRAPNSNWGTEDVDIFAPYWYFIGERPDKPGNFADWGTGTSYSSPYVAGVAALIQAADPSQSNHDVLNQLIGNARGSFDPQVTRFVDAQRAVHAVLGDLPPSVEITAPTDGTSTPNGSPTGILLSATTEDYEDGDGLSITWSTDVTGELGFGTERLEVFDPGVYTITATVTDSAGNVGADSVTVTIENSPPIVSIIEPTDGGMVPQNFPVLLQGSGYDFDAALAPMACADLAWTIFTPGATTGSSQGTGCFRWVSFTETGLHTIRLEGTDAQGTTTQAEVALDVISAAGSGPPYATIIEPLPDAGAPDATTQWQAIGAAINPDDPDGNAPLTYEWSIMPTGGTEVVIGTGPIIDFVPGDYLTTNCGPRYGDLILRVTDSEGETTTVQIQISVFYPIC